MASETKLLVDFLTYKGRPLLKSIANGDMQSAALAVEAVNGDPTNQDSLNRVVKLASIMSADSDEEGSAGTGKQGSKLNINPMGLSTMGLALQTIGTVGAHGFNAAGDVRKNDANRLAQALLQRHGNRQTAAQEQMFGRSDLSRAIDARATDKLRRGERDAIILKAIGDTIGTALGNVGSAITLNDSLRNIKEAGLTGAQLQGASSLGRQAGRSKISKELGI